ncbi:MAG TPA: mechanosensitive ion channel domain-containing protein [Polyangiaceae bacterium]|nr:mechanosensitive ion channel domain-containing protein [Polyangiaceae bacterium]
MCFVPATLAAAPPPAAAASGAPAAVPPKPPAAANTAPPAALRIQDKVLYEVRRDQGRLSAAQRAQRGNEALREVVKSDAEVEIRVEHQAGVAVVFAGSRPILQLSPEDAEAAGDASLDVHAAAFAARLRDAVGSERRRSALAERVFSASLAVLFALTALYLLRRIGEFAGRTRSWIATNPDRIPAVRLKSLEVIRPAGLRHSLLAGIEAGKWLAYLGTVYVWILASLSLFASTRGYTERLTGFVLSPLSALAGRVVSALPVLIIAAFAALTVAIALRFLRLFFASVARGETPLVWLPPDLAEPTGVIVQAAVVIAALVFAAPVITGDTDGVLSRTGTVLMVTLALASTPLLASAVVGAGVVFGRRLHVGDQVEFGGRRGRVRAISLLEVELSDPSGNPIRVPQLMSLLHPTRVLVSGARTAVELAAPLGPNVRELGDLLEGAAATVGATPRVEIVKLDPEAVWFRVSVQTDHEAAESALYFALAEALQKSAPQTGRVPSVQAAS